MDCHNLFLIACNSFVRLLNLETLTHVRGQTLPGFQILFYLIKKTDSQIWFSHLWEPVVRFLVRASHSDDALRGIRPGCLGDIRVMPKDIWDTCPTLVGTCICGCVIWSSIWCSQGNVRKYKVQPRRKDEDYTKEKTGKISKH
jgi:hypothetical protein